MLKTDDSILEEVHPSLRAMVEKGDGSGQTAGVIQACPSLRMTMEKGDGNGQVAGVCQCALFMPPLFPLFLFFTSSTPHNHFNSFSSLTITLQEQTKMV